MKAEDTLVTNLLQGAKQFIVPIFQRDYSWGTKHCQQLWKDVIRVGSDPNVKGHRHHHALVVDRRPTTPYYPDAFVDRAS